MSPFSKEGLKPPVMEGSYRGALVRAWHPARVSPLQVPCTSPKQGRERARGSTSLDTAWEKDTAFYYQKK